MSGPGGLLSPSTWFSLHAQPPRAGTGDRVLRCVVSGGCPFAGKLGKRRASLLLTLHGLHFWLHPHSAARLLTAHRLLDTYASVFKNLSFKDQHFRVFRCASHTADMPLSMAYLCSGSNILSTVCCRKEFPFFLLRAESTMLCCCEALSSSYKLLGFFGSFCNPQGAWAVGRRLSSLCR